MGYPGDQQQPGGWSPYQPPQSPYGPADDQAAQGGSPYDRFEPPRDEPPYGGGPPAGSAFDPRSTSSYGGPYSSDDVYGTEPGDPYGRGPGSYGPGPGAGPPYGEDPYGRGPSYESYDSGEDELRTGPDRKRWIIGAAVVAGIVVLGGGTALALTSGGDDKPKAASTPRAAPPTRPTITPTPSPTETGTGDRLQSRTTDPRLLTLNEVFKNKRFKSGGRTYTMTARHSDRKCSAGAHGTSFRRALTKEGCNQVVRATFSNGKFVGTIGVLNLRTQAAAEVAQKASRPKDAFITPLPGSGTSNKIGQGLALTTAEANGHYLIMSWIQYPTGKKIAKSDYAGVTSFVRNATYGSNLRPALNYRSMEGKPS